MFKLKEICSDFQYSPLITNNENTKCQKGSVTLCQDKHIFWILYCGYFLIYQPA